MNDDLISRSAAVEMLREKARGYVVSKFATSEHCRLARSVALEAATEIAAMPAVDAVPVTRCKDCAHYVLFESDVAVKHCELYEQYDGECTDHNIGPDHFCSLGETVEEMQYRMAMEQDMWESMQSMCNPEDGSL